MASIIEGPVPILSTPFDEKGRIDEEDLRAEVEFLIKAGATALSFGFGAEVPTFTDAERKWAVGVVVDQVKGRVPVVAATGTQSIAHSVALSQAAQEAGAEGLLVTPPYQVKPTVDQMYAYYKGISDAVKIPIMVQDAFGATGVAMPAAFLARMAAEIENVRYLKLESAPIPTKISDVHALVGDKAIILGGAGGTYFPLELGRGCRGTMPGASYIEVFAKVWDLWKAGDRKGATAHFNRYLPLIIYSGQTNETFLWSHKEMFRLAGIFKTSHLRSPYNIPDEATRKDFYGIIEGLDFLALRK